jgi:serine/threonine-protein kinase
MVMSALTAGDVLGGKWRIVRPAIGDEPGSEYRVEPLEGGGARRLTLWRTLRAPTSVELKRFEELVRAGERTRHPAFQPVEAVGYDPALEALWMVRPWWNGESLPSMLGGLHPVGLDLPYLHSLADQLAQALSAAQAAGLAHGRLRPTRLLVAPGGSKGVRLCILDLGLEVFRRDHAPTWLRAPQVGAAYLAPELGETGPVPASADVFSFGLIVRDMLTTRRDGAWQGRWEHWVEQATSPEAGRRFGCLTEAMKTLVPVLKTLPDLPPPPPPNYEPEPPTA